MRAQSAGPRPAPPPPPRRGVEYAIGFPQTAYNFITAVPAGKLDRREFTLPIDSAEKLAIAMAAVNSHVAYAWWKAYGDAFDLNPYEMATVAIPNQWIEVEGARRRISTLGRKLIRAINPHNIEVRQSGTKGKLSENVNFHNCMADTIMEIDKLYLSAFGLPREPLLTQLRMLRSDSSWRVG